MKRQLYLLHRWLGLFGCLLVTLWFFSGFVMMYVPFPELTQSERLTALLTIDMSRVHVQPLQVLKAAAGDKVLQFRLLQPDHTPIYVLYLKQRGWMVVDAERGGTVQIDIQTAAHVAERFSGQRSIVTKLIERDQWSVSDSLDSHRPLYAVHMADGGLHYVSSRTGEVVRDTRRAERGWNWVGAVLHWVYPTELRSRPSTWHWTVITFSSYTLLTAVLGTIIGMLRWRRYANGKYTPYIGWLCWHHLLGLMVATFLVGWLFSGLLSMNPGQIFSPRQLSAQHIAAWSGNTFLDELTLPPIWAGVKEVEWLADSAGPLVWLRSTVTQSRLLRGGQTVVIDAGFIRDRALALGFGMPIAIERLDVLDLHYHVRNAMRPLPVWRLRFNDREQTWVHVDERSGQPFACVNSSNRMQRWFYHGLHSWDFELLLAYQPLRDILMLSVLSLGAMFSITSLVIAWRRLARYWNSF